MINHRGPCGDKDPVVLCIDDDPDISHTIALRLRRYRVQVLRAFHGMHGLCLALEYKPDLIITDLNMPQGGGRYLIERLRNHPGTVGLPILVLTGQQNPQAIAAVRHLGPEHVLLKPIHFDALAAAITKFVPLTLKHFGAQHTACHCSGGRSILNG